MRSIVARRSLDTLRITFAAVLLTYVWRVQDLVPGLAALRVPTIATGAAILLLLLDGSAQRQLSIALNHRVGRLTVVFAIVAAISVITSINVGWSLDYFTRALIPALALAVVIPSGVFKPRDASLFAAMQVVGAAMYSLAILIRFHVGADGRLGSLVFYDGNDVGMLLVCTLPLCAYFARHAMNGFARILAFCSAILFVFTIAETGSRGAFLGLIAVGLYVLLRFRTVAASVRVLAVAVAVVLLAAGATTKYWSAMATILHPTADYNWAGHSDQGRMDIWKRGIEYAEERPLTGVGVASFNVAEGTMSSLARRQEYGKGVKWSSPHNSFIQVLAELGVPGFLIFLCLLFAAYRSAAGLALESMRRGPDAARNGELAQAHAAAIVGYVVSGFFLSQAYAPYLYFVVGMIVGLDVTVRTAWRADDLTEEEVSEPEPAPDGGHGAPVMASIAANN